MTISDKRLAEITDGATLSAAIRIVSGYQEAHSTEAVIAGLKRQRDELHDTANRYLERARSAEAKAKQEQRWRETAERTADIHERSRIKADEAVMTIDEFVTACQQGRFIVFDVEQHRAEGRRRLAELDAARKASRERLKAALDRLWRKVTFR